MLFFVGSTMAQPTTRLVREANKMYANENYCEAADKCSLAYAQISRSGKRAKSKKAEMAFKTAECFRQVEQYKNAQDWYDRAILLDYPQTEPKVLFYNAEMLHRLGDNEKALSNLEEYKKLVPSDGMAEVLMISMEKSKDYQENKTRYIVTNEAALNKPEFDMSAAFGDRKESQVYFSSSRPGSTGGFVDPRSCENYMDIWVSEKDKKGNWSEPVLIDGEFINTEDNEGAVSFDGRFKTMFFTRCPNVKKQNLGCDIWVSEAQGKGKWKEPTKLVLKSNDSITVGHPCSSEDGKYLIFASDMPGGVGGRDLWYSTFDKKADTWSTPRNLGPEINTPGDELFPTFGKNGDLLFSSNGHPGLGSLDIFRAMKVGDEFKWENPQNMGSPINSEAADFSLYEVNERNGYFTSERKSENGDIKPDIYSYILPPNLFDLKVAVSELGDKNAIIAGTKVVVTGSDGTSFEGVTADNGLVSWEKKPNGERYLNEDVSYNIIIEKEGFVEDKTGSKFTTKGLENGQTFILEMALLPKTPIRLPEVRYPLGEFTLLVDSTFNSKDSLNFVYELMTEYPGMVLELSSHTDARGSDKANQSLSESRAMECVRYLVEEKGMDSSRFIAVGKGEREPATYLDPETKDTLTLTEEFINQFKKDDNDKFEFYHQLNRRTEGRVVRMDYIKAEPALEVEKNTEESEGKKP